MAELSAAESRGEATPGRTATLARYSQRGRIHVSRGQKVTQADSTRRTGAVVVAWKQVRITFEAVHSLLKLDWPVGIIVCVVQEWDPEDALALRAVLPEGSLVVELRENLGFARAANLGIGTVISARPTGFCCSTIGASDRMVLEVGCGPGGNIQWLEERGVQMLGLDLSSAMLQAARRSGVTRLVQGDATSLPIASHAVNAAITVTVLQHNDDEAAAQIVAEAAVSPGGAFICSRTPGAWPSTIVHPIGCAGRSGTWPSSAAPAIASRRGCVSHLHAPSSWPTGCTPSRRRRPEGAAIAENQMRLESKLLGVTTRIDSLLPPAMGLTRLSFTHFLRLIVSP